MVWSPLGGRFLPQSLPQANVELGSCRCLRTLRLVSSMGLDRSFTSTCLFSAKEVADLTNPSISAPLKFFVRSATQTRSCHVSGKGLLCTQYRGSCLQRLGHSQQREGRPMSASVACEGPQSCTAGGAEHVPDPCVQQDGKHNKGKGL